MQVQFVCVCTQPLSSTAVYLLTFRLIINTALKTPCEAKGRCKSNYFVHVKECLKQKTSWSDLNSFLHQGIRNQSRPSVSVSNLQCSGSCCLIMVCEDLGPNPQRHPGCLFLLPSRGPAIHRCQVEGSFSQGECHCRRLWRGVEDGGWEWVLRGGRALLRCSARHYSLFIRQGKQGHTLRPWLWKSW